jgi:hypothetical protein
MSKKLNSEVVESEVAVIGVPVVTETGEVVEQVVEAEAPAAQKVGQTFRKFAQAGDNDANIFGITNNRGEIVTNSYLRRYIQCWCRAPHGYTKNRKANFDYFMSEEFLSLHIGKTASQIGKAASSDARWGLVKPAPAPADEPADEAATDEAPVDVASIIDIANELIDA